MDKFDGMLSELGRDDFPFPYMRKKAEELGISTSAELQKFLDHEAYVNSVADALPYNIRKQGDAYRRKVAEEIIGRM